LAFHVDPSRCKRAGVLFFPQGIVPFATIASLGINAADGSLSGSCQLSLM